MTKQAKKKYVVKVFRPMINGESLVCPGDIIYHAMRKKKCTIYKIAHLTGINKLFLHNYLTRGMNPAGYGASYIARIMAVADLTIEDLVESYYEMQEEKKEPETE